MDIDLEGYGVMLACVSRGKVLAGSGYRDWGGGGGAVEGYRPQIRDRRRGK